MSDKANTKHGNMVALGPYLGFINNNQSDVPLFIGAYDGTRTIQMDYVTMPFDGRICAMCVDGDIPAVGTLNFVVTSNTTAIERTRTNITANSTYYMPNSSDSIRFLAGDRIGVSAAAAGDYEAADAAKHVVMIYVMFSNA